jgi:ribosomal subunit interface protein
VQVDIRGQNVSLSGALAGHCVERLTRALRPFDSRIARVQVVFVDLNGPKKGLGQACRMRVHLLHGGVVRFESRREDYYRAASETIAGVVRRIQRALTRARHVAVRASAPSAAAG